MAKLSDSVSIAASKIPAGVSDHSYLLASLVLSDGSEDNSTLIVFKGLSLHSFHVEHGLNGIEIISTERPLPESQDFESRFDHAFFYIYPYGNVGLPSIEVDATIDGVPIVNEDHLGMSGRLSGGIEMDQSIGGIVPRETHILGLDVRIKSFIELSCTILVDLTTGKIVVPDQVS